MIQNNNNNDNNILDLGYEVQKNDTEYTKFHSVITTYFETVFLFYLFIIKKTVEH